MQIDKNVLKFGLAVLIIGASIELVDNIDRKAAYILGGTVLLGVVLNNPLALALINASANSLGDQVK